MFNLSDEDALNIKRRIQQKRKPLEDCYTFPSPVKAAEVRTTLPRNHSNCTLVPSTQSELDMVSKVSEAVLLELMMSILKYEMSCVGSGNLLPGCCLSSSTCHSSSHQPIIHPLISLLVNLSSSSAPLTLSP